MGNCLTCFKVPPAQGASPGETNTENAPQKHHEETSELLQDGQFQQTTIATPNVNSNQPTAIINGNASQVIGSDNIGSLNINSVKTKTFYHKIPSINPKNMGTDISKISESKIQQLFEIYKDPNTEVISEVGIERLCNDLTLRPDDFKILVLAWKLNAEQMCRFTKNEFITGLKSMKTDSIRSIQTKLPEIVKELESNVELFKDLYRFTFKFGLDITSGQRILPAEMAIILWRLVFSINEPQILSRWLNFLQNHQHIRGIPKDTWNMFLNFAESVKGDVDLSGYDDTEAWPSLFDDFVEYENDQMNQNISKNNIIKESTTLEPATTMTSGNTPRSQDNSDLSE